MKSVYNEICVQWNLCTMKSVHNEICVKRNLCTMKSVYNEICAQRNLCTMKSVYNEICVQWNLCTWADYYVCGLWLSYVSTIICENNHMSVQLYKSENSNNFVGHSRSYNKMKICWRRVALKDFDSAIIMCWSGTLHAYATITSYAKEHSFFPTYSLP